MLVAFLTPFGYYQAVPDHHRRLAQVQLNRPNDRFLHVEIDMHIVSKARTLLVERVPPEVDVVWFVDSDILLPDNAHTMLGTMEEHNLPVLSGMYVSRFSPHAPQAYNLAAPVHLGQHAYLPITEIPEGLFQVDAVGAGCLCLRRDVFFEMERAWEADRKEAIRVAGLSKFPDSQAVRQFLQLGLTLGPWFEFLNGVGEDFYLCERLARLGVEYRPWVDPSVFCDHVGLAHYNRAHFESLRQNGLVLAAEIKK